jgi:hypothetical protein
MRVTFPLLNEFGFDGMISKAQFLYMHLYRHALHVPNTKIYFLISLNLLPNFLIFPLFDGLALLQNTTSGPIH